MLQPPLDSPSMAHRTAATVPETTIAMMHCGHCVIMVLAHYFENSIKADESNFGKIFQPEKDLWCDE